jgi:hypothetical protein
MSRSGYSDDLEENLLNLYRGNVDRAIKGKRGQSFLKELAKALDEMPEKRLIRNELISEAGVCAIGSFCKAHGLDVSKVDECDPQEVGDLVGIARPLAAEIAYLNDDHENYRFYQETPEQRWSRMREWVRDQCQQ